VWDVEKGTRAADIRSALGRPARILQDLNGPEPGRVGPCWLYPARKPGTNITYVNFCFDKRDRVALIRYSVHL
jgi:hypothetical protein